MIWYVYLLKCFDNSIYTGATNNVEKRVTAHNAKKGAKYTRGRTPVILLKSIPCKNRSAALSLETKIKKLTQQQKLDLCCSCAFATISEICPLHHYLTQFI